MGLTRCRESSDDDRVRDEEEKDSDGESGRAKEEVRR